MAECDWPDLAYNKALLKMEVYFRISLNAENF
jgi:hypothetical protein